MTEKENDVTWALDLFTSKEQYEHSAYPYGYPIVLGGVGFTVACATNFLLKKPIISGIQKHILLTIGTAAAGVWYQKRAEGVFAERDAIYRDYIKLHPEHFPPPGSPIAAACFAGLEAMMEKSELPAEKFEILRAKTQFDFLNKLKARYSGYV